jgi:hypothetical protein
MLLERRSAIRYPIVLNAQFQPVRKKPNAGGAGRTVDISSRGLRIAAEHKVRVGLRLDVSIEWPILLDGVVELSLVATGRVVRVWESSFALELSQHEFRTVKRKSNSAAAGFDQSAGMATGASARSKVPTATARLRVPEYST